MGLIGRERITAFQPMILGHPAISDRTSLMGGGRRLQERGGTQRSNGRGLPPTTFECAEMGADHPPEGSEPHPGPPTIFLALGERLETMGASRFDMGGARLWRLTGRGRGLTRAPGRDARCQHTSVRALPPPRAAARGVAPVHRSVEKSSNKDDLR